MLHVVGPFGDHLPAGCENSCRDAWAVFDAFTTKYAYDLDTTERITRVLRPGLALFGQSALPIASSVVLRMITSFEATGFSAFLWIAGKVVTRFGRESDPELKISFQALYERSTSKIVSLLQTTAPRDIPDGMYFSTLHTIWLTIAHSAGGLCATTFTTRRCSSRHLLPVICLCTGFQGINGSPYFDSI